jgi:trehalose/maltose hydrolase-like predicted phosphorylase
MAIVVTGEGRAPGAPQLPPPLRRRFEAVLFDWDGTAVPDRGTDATRVRVLVEALSDACVDVVVVSGTNLANVDGQLAARPSGPGRVHLCLNRGSEVFRVGSRGPRRIEVRRATAAEEAALDAAARLAVQRLAARGLRSEIVSQRLNRRKIDLIPEPSWADPPKARIGELLAAVLERLHDAGIDDLREVVRIAEEAATDAGLRDARVTSDAKHVEIGLTDKSDSGRWAFGALASRGIPASMVLLAGDEFGALGGLPGSDSLMLVPEAAGATAVTVGTEPEGVPSGVLALGGGPDAFLGLLEHQLALRRRRAIPDAERDPAWSLAVDGVHPMLERVHESLLTIADGRIGTSGSPLAPHPAATPAVRAAGLYVGEGSETSLLACPVWAQTTDWLGAAALRRVLDLRGGVLFEERTTDEGSVGSVRFSSLARPGTAVLRAASSDAIALAPAPSLPPGLPGEQGSADGGRWARLETERGGLVTAVRDETLTDEHGSVVERISVYVPEPDRPPRRTRALHGLVDASADGFDRLLREHRAAWAERWAGADVAVPGDPELQHAIRVSLFHLMASVADQGEAAVGARGLTGPAYRGHVFWDSDVFVLPFLAATHPPAARAMLEYRIRRLPAARAIALAAGRSGARFPWESAATGYDVTPEFARDRTGHIVPIRTGHLEEHIVADVAWAASWYEDWTGDRGFLTGPARDLVVDTARYWLSRVRFDRNGLAHIYGVIGPDEYHEPVDDNAFTNVMARWNLRRAAELLVDDDGSAFERMRMLEVADALVDGYDERTRVYEQFAGFFDLEPLVIADVAPQRPIAADVLLGRERVRGAQVIKQADVLMLHHLVPDAVAPGSLEPNLDVYEPRTAHGSSLSPGIHASLFARAGRLEEAVRALDLAARMDLDDLTGTTSGGLHLATMGSLWQAIVLGFGGVRARDGALEADPHVPEAWGTVEIRLRFRGSRVVISASARELAMTADPPVRVRVEASAPLEVGPAGRRWKRGVASWEAMT